MPDNFIGGSPIVYNTPYPTEQGGTAEIPNFLIPDLVPHGEAFNEDNSVKELPLEDKLMQSLLSGIKQPTPIRELSQHEYLRFNDPNIKIRANTDLESLYAGLKPTTWSKVFHKTYATVETNLFSSMQTLASGIAALNREGWSKENWTKIYDNEYSNHLAEVTKRLEVEMPFYQTKDQQENPFKYGNWTNTIKQLLPSAGTAISAIIEMATVDTAITGLATLVSSPVGGVSTRASLMAAKVPAMFAMGARLSALGTRSKAVTSAFKGVRQSSQTLNGMRGVNAIGQAGTAVRYVGTGLFAANGEAALEAVMASGEFVEKRIQAYIAKHGKYPVGAELAKIEAAGKKVANSTYTINLGVLTASNMVQFPRLLKGTWSSAMIGKMASPVGGAGKSTVFKSAKKTSDQLFTRAEKRNAFTASIAYMPEKGFIPKGIVPEVIKDSFSEGMEEYLQGVAKDYSSQFYAHELDGTADKAKSFMDVFRERSNTNEGLLEFAGGALIGGLMGGGGGLYNTLTDNEIKKYNSGVETFNERVDHMERSVKTAMTNKKQLEAILSGRLNAEVAAQVGQVADAHTKRVVKSNLHDLAGFHFARGTGEVALLDLKDLRNMDIQELNNVLGLEENPMEAKDRNDAVDFLETNFRTSLEVIGSVEKWGAVNPLNQASTFKKVMSKVPLLGKFFNTSDEMSNYVWNSLKSDFSRYEINKEIVKEDINDMVNEIKNMDRGDLGILDIIASNSSDESISPLKAIKNIVEEFKTKLNELNGIDGLKKSEVNLKEKLSSNKDYVAALTEILDHYKFTDKEKSNIGQLFYAINARHVFSNKSKSLNTKAGINRRAGEIVELLKWSAINREAKAAEEARVAEDVEPETTAEPEETLNTDIPDDGKMSEEQKEEKKRPVITRTKIIISDGVDEIFDIDKDSTADTEFDIQYKETEEGEEVKIKTVKAKISDIEFVIPADTVPSTIAKYSAEALSVEENKEFHTENLTITYNGVSKTDSTGGELILTGKDALAFLDEQNTLFTFADLLTISEARVKVSSGYIPITVNTTFDNNEQLTKISLNLKTYTKEEKQVKDDSINKTLLVTDPISGGLKVPDLRSEGIVNVLKSRLGIDVIVRNSIVYAKKGHLFKIVSNGKTLYVKAFDWKNSTYNAEKDIIETRDSKPNGIYNNIQAGTNVNYGVSPLDYMLRKNAVITQVSFNDTTVLDSLEKNGYFRAIADIHKGLAVTMNVESMSADDFDIEQVKPEIRGIFNRINGSTSAEDKAYSEDVYEKLYSAFESANRVVDMVKVRAKLDEMISAGEITKAVSDTMYSAAENGQIRIEC